MPFETPYAINPFASPIIGTYSSTSSILDADIPTQQPDILTTANLLLEQLKELETLCSAAEERVQRKRQTVKDLEKLIAASAATTTSPPPPSPAISATTPISRRLRFKSPRLRGLFDLRGPGKANSVSFQNPQDYSPETQAATYLQAAPMSAEKELGQAQVASVEEEWEDDDEEAPLLCPFDDKYALKLQESQSPLNAEKPLPAIPIHSEPEEEVRTTRIPKLHLKRRVSTSKYFTGRSGAVTRVPSSKRRPILRHASAKQLESATSPKGLKKKGTIRRELEQRGRLENVNGKMKAGMKAPHVNENENISGKEGTRRKEKRKGLWSIYSVYSELGLSGSHHTVSTSSG